MVIVARNGRRNEGRKEVESCTVCVCVCAWFPHTQACPATGTIFFQVRRRAPHAITTRAKPSLCRRDARPSSSSGRACGRTSAAREIARQRGAGWSRREFGKQDYLNAKGFRRALRALTARKGGGLLVQMGVDDGTVAIFDDVGTAPHDVQRAVVALMERPPRSLAVVCVVTALAGIPRLRWRIKSSGVHVVRLGRPTDDQVRRILGEGADPPPAVRADFRALLAASPATTARAPTAATSPWAGTRPGSWPATARATRSGRTARPTTSRWRYSASAARPGASVPPAARQ